MINPLVSVIVPTKNSSEFLEACLQSIKDQTYENIELIVVDNFSDDSTVEIAKRYCSHVFSKGNERSAQRNYGVERSSGYYVLIIDSDMELAPEVVSDSVNEIVASNDIRSVVIPEESFGSGFWAQCKALERSFYLNVDWIEAARFFKRSDFTAVGGYDVTMVSGEDWDISQRINKNCFPARTKSIIRHNEGQLRLSGTLRKKYYYSKQFAAYAGKYSGQSSLSKQVSILARYKLFFKSPNKLARRPMIGLGMMFMKTFEFGIGALGYFSVIGMQRAHEK